MKDLTKTTVLLSMIATRSANRYTTILSHLSSTCPPSVSAMNPGLQNSHWPWPSLPANWPWGHWEQLVAAPKENEPSMDAVVEGKV